MPGLVKLKSGDHRVLRFQIRTPDGAPRDLTGVEFEMRVASTLAGPAVVTKSTGMGDVTVFGDPLNGVVEVSFVPVDTDALEGQYLYEFQLVDGLGQILTVQHADGRFWAPMFVEPDLIV
jgi:hypothetical protein